MVHVDRRPGRRRGTPAVRARAGRRGSPRGAARGRGGPGSAPAPARRGRHRTPRPTAPRPTVRAAVTPRPRSTDAVVGARLVAQRDRHRLRTGAGAASCRRQQVSGARDRRLLEVAATDAPPHLVVGHHHLRARLARRMAADLGDRDQHPGSSFASQPLDRCQPVHHGTSAVVEATLLRARVQGLGADRGLVGHQPGQVPPRSRRCCRPPAPGAPGREPSRPPRVSPVRPGRRWPRHARRHLPPAAAPRGPRTPASGAAHRRPSTRRRRRPRERAAAARRAAPPASR